jgi:hypothetical protein
MRAGDHVWLICISIPLLGANRRLRLVTQLYSEQLIDQATFLKWCLTYSEKSSIELSPIIVIVIGIFWDDLIARRATGRKLTELLLDKVDMVLSSFTFLTLDLQIFKIPRPCSRSKLNRRKDTSHP